MTVALHSSAKESIVSLEGDGVSEVSLRARLRDLVLSARSFRAASDFSLDSRRDVGVEEREGRREGRLRVCQEVRAVWRGAVSSLLLDEVDIVV